MRAPATLPGQYLPTGVRGAAGRTSGPGGQLETVGQVAERAVELGIVAPGALTALDADDLREPLSYYDDDPAAALVDLLAELGVAVRVDAKSGGDLLDGYRSLFDSFAACTGGAVTITDIELYEGNAGERIRMLVDGDVLDWHVEHGDSRRYLDTLMVFEIADSLTPRADTDPRVFTCVLDADGDSGHVFADPTAFAVLAAELGVTLD
ncbi:hypothetical protein GCM10022220_25510 [Actinocatenispora rupis]|uniref:Uncharacterized protein n=1 Tax=Actinocatenispora rupis TaxID=519421 RepID=A0A8J3IZ02_9ACTN|nr:hypothetical protein Aru02nite_21170 [Actinocatenispora rupis]